jgi:hypothetical protein
MAHSGPCFQIEGADLVVRQSRDRGVDKADIASDLYPLGKGNHRRHPLVLIMEVRPVFNVDFRRYRDDGGCTLGFLRRNPTSLTKIGVLAAPKADEARTTCEPR